MAAAFTRHLCRFCRWRGAVDDALLYIFYGLEPLLDIFELASIFHEEFCWRQKSANAALAFDKICCHMFVIQAR